MKFKVNKIAAAVAVSLGTSVVGMNAAQADEVFFPNLVASNSVTTILSVINDDDFSVPDLHYRYYYQTNNGAPCAEANYKQPTSKNDVVTFDIGGVFGDSKGVLFEPAPVKAQYDKSFAIFKNVKPVRAFAVIDNNDVFFAGQGIEGEAFLIEFTQGSVWGYPGYNAAEIVGWQNGQVVVANPYDFSDRVENNGEVLVPTPTGSDPDNYGVPIAVMPWSGNIQTALFVTPVSTNQLSGNISATVGLTVNDPSNVAPDVMYDRDENPFSGARLATITCVGRVDVPNLVSTATQQFLEDSGGWSNVVVTSGQAVVMKLEYNDTAPAELDGKPTGSGSWNNGYWLRKGIRESVARRAYTITGPAKWMPVFEVPKDQTLNSPFPLVDVAAAVKKGLPWPPAYGADPVPYLEVASNVQ